MMKMALRVYKWIIISAVIQVFILLFFNNIYLSSRGEAKATLVEVETTQEKKPKKKPVTVDIAQKADDVRVSYDHTYMSYMLDGKLEIYDIKNKKTVKTISHKKDIITYYRWLPDRNMIIYALRSPDEEAGAVQVITYSIDSEVQHDYPRITKIARKSKIVSIELSPLTNSVYVQVKTSDTDSAIYRYNVMSQLSYIMNVSADTIIKEMNYKDRLVYQDGKNKINVYNWDETRSTTSTLPFKGKMVLLGVYGPDDIVYAGELDGNNTINKIYYGKAEEDLDKLWKSVSLKKPAEPENIVVTSEERIFEVLDSKNVINDIASGKDISFEGKLLEISDKHVVSIEDKKLIITEFEDE